MFITFEGVEGSGKSTQARRLAETLTSEGRDVVATREPGGSPLAETLRRVVLEGDPDDMDAHVELLIFTAARRDHIRRVIRPALARGAIVICDRYVGSTRALQGAAGVSSDLIESLHRSFCDLDPDLTVFFDFDAATGLERSLGRLGADNIGEGRMEAKGLDFHGRVDAIMRRLAAQDPTWTTVDASGTIDEVGSRVRDAVVSHGKFPGRAAA